MIEDIKSKLFELQDKKYRDFNIRLIPNLPPDSIIGVRTPQLRLYARHLAESEVSGAFIKDLPHAYFEENQLHAFIISGIRDYDLCVAELNIFLPYIDNWATCDQLSPKVFKRHKVELLNEINKWLSSDKTYILRFAIGMLMQHFLDADFDLSLSDKVAAVSSDEYYVNMMIAWYFATALAKRYDEVLPFIEHGRLSAWTHNKAIQKALESLRISSERKSFLRTLKL